MLIVHVLSTKGLMLTFKLLKWSMLVKVINFTIN